MFPEAKRMTLVKFYYLINTISKVKSPVIGGYRSSVPADEMAVEEYGGGFKHCI
jgi:hypothetical protein